MCYTIFALGYKEKEKWSKAVKGSDEKNQCLRIWSLSEQVADRRGSGRLEEAGASFVWLVRRDKER